MAISIVSKPYLVVVVVVDIDYVFVVVDVVFLSVFETNLLGLVKIGSGSDEIFRSCC